MIADITSAVVPPVRIEGSAVVEGARVVLPVRELGAGRFTVETSACGLPQVVDPRGMRCGMFANEQLAHATARRLSQ